MKPEDVKTLSVPFPPEVIKQKGGIGFSADYVDHAHVTERLLAVDPAWTWEPLATDDNGVPLLVPVGGMSYLWGRMTVLGVTRIEVGSVESDKKEALKEAVSDFIKRAAMRFGVALHLWMGETVPAPKKSKAAGSAGASRRPAAIPSEADSGPAAIPAEVTSGDLKELAGRADEAGVNPAGLKTLASEVLGRTIGKASDIKTHAEIEVINQALDAREAA
jgi:hypothetical protein